MFAPLVLGAVLGGAGVYAWQWEPPTPGVEGPTLAEQVDNLSDDIARLDAEREQLQKELDESRSRLEDVLREASDADLAAKAEAGALAEEGRELRGKLDEAASQLTVAESAKEHLASELATAQQELGALRQNLAFFEQLIPVDAKKGPISIRSAELAREPDGVRFRVLVMRNGPGSGEFTGTLQFVATGTRAGESATMTLEPVASAPTSSGAGPATGGGANRLKFQQYQRVDGTLAVPAGFEPESVTVRVLEGRTVRSEHLVGLTPKESPP